MQGCEARAETLTERGTGAMLRQARLHLRENRPLESARYFLEIVRQKPDCFEACCQLGLIFYRGNNLGEALACLQRAARLNPSFPKLQLMLGAVLKKLGRLEEAAGCCRREIRLAPKDADAHYNLGLVLQRLDRLDEAGDAYRKALEVRPGYVDALINLGDVLRRTGDTHRALHCFEAAVSFEPKNADAHWELCTVLLSLGDFTRGWKHYEWRWKLKDFTTPPSRFEQPQWGGGRLEGRRILLHCEQGLGDTIQFVRYASLVAERGGEVILGCPRSLRSLLQSVPGVCHVVTHRAEVPQFDVHAPLMSLPAIFGTTLDAIPAEIPYLSAPVGGTPLTGEAGRLKVGLVWAGDPAHRDDHKRSVPLECLRPALQLSGIQWFSLQVGGRAGDLMGLNLEHEITDLGSGFQDFADTARAISQLDLVISVDTAVAHLAGALGKEVWTLLPFPAEWRWMQSRSDTPWYPSMRLFRQSSAQSWPGLLETVAQELARLVPAQLPA